MIDLYLHPYLPNVWVSPDGRVFEEKLPKNRNQKGYVAVYVCRQTVQRSHLVCETFHGERPSGQEARHLDGNPAHDTRDNLAWGTHRRNMTDMVEHGRSQRGRKNTFNKLPEDRAKELKRRLMEGESGAALAREFGMSPQLCCDIKNGRAWAWL